MPDRDYAEEQQRLLVEEVQPEREPRLRDGNGVEKPGLVCYCHLGVHVGWREPREDVRRVKKVVSSIVC